MWKALLTLPLLLLIALLISLFLFPGKVGETLFPKTEKANAPAPVPTPTLQPAQPQPLQVVQPQAVPPAKVLPPSAAIKPLPPKAVPAPAIKR